MTSSQLNVSTDIKSRHFLKKVISPYTQQGQLIIIALVLCILFLIISQNSSPVQTEQQLSISVVPSSQNDWTIEQLLLVKEPYNVVNDNYVNLGKRNHLWLKVKLESQAVKSTQNENLILVLKKNRIYTPLELHYLTKNKIWQKKVIHGNPQFQHNIVSNLPSDPSLNAKQVLNCVSVKQVLNSVDHAVTGFAHLWRPRGHPDLCFDIIHRR